MARRVLRLHGPWSGGPFGTPLSNALARRPLFPAWSGLGASRGTTLGLYFLVTRLHPNTVAR